MATRCSTLHTRHRLELQVILFLDMLQSLPYDIQIEFYPL